MSITRPNCNVKTEEHPETTTESPVVRFDDKLKDEILSQIREQGMVIEHCIYNAEMIVATSGYWNVIHGRTPGEVSLDGEGVHKFYQMMPLNRLFTRKRVDFVV